MPEQYQTLNQGDIRQSGDEVSESCPGVVAGGYNSRSSHKKLPPGPWKPTQASGQVVLGSDLLHLEFRRKVA